MHIKVFLYKFGLKLVALTIGNASESLLRRGTLYTAEAKGYRFVHFPEGRLFGDRHQDLNNVSWQLGITEMGLSVYIHRFSS